MVMTRKTCRLKFDIIYGTQGADGTMCMGMRDCTSQPNECITEMYNVQGE